MSVEFEVGSFVGVNFSEGLFEEHLAEYMENDLEGAYSAEEAEQVAALVRESAERFRGRERGGYDMSVSMSVPEMEFDASITFWEDVDEYGICLHLPMGEDIAAECAAAREQMDGNVWFAEEGWVDEIERELSCG